MNIRVDTQFPVAFDSPDHLHPWGTINDNHTNSNFIDEVFAYFNNDIKSFLDIGCSGGKLVRDISERGIISVGIEGSDVSAKAGRAEWADLYNINLFTCDASRPYTIYNDDEPLKFDCITAWEVIEHIHPDRLDTFFLNIYNHLSDRGIFVGSISLRNDNPEGVELHLSVFSRDHWETKILNKYLKVAAYPFVHKVRNEESSFYVLLRK